MTDHVKPTKEELEENIKKVTEELDKTVKPTTDETTTEVTTDKVSDTTTTDDTTNASEETTEEKVETKPEIDYKKKFTDSSREALILHSKNKKINDTIEKANALPDPTDEELQGEYKEWDVMSETERKLAKSNFINERRFKMLDEVTKESKDIESWNTKVDEFVDDPKTLQDHPELEGKTDDFKMFVNKPSRRGVEFTDLVSAFLYDAEKTAKPKQKGKMFETGTGGPNDAPKKDKLTLTEGQALMKTNYNKYKELLKAGKIEMTP